MRFNIKLYMSSFKELGIRKELVSGVEDLGFVNPMPIQEEVIEILLQNKKDLVGLAQTGTGKTAAFGLPLLQLISTKSMNTQALILCPTRELCIQISNDLKNFAKYLEDINIVPIYGGASIDTQIRQVSKGAHIIVATPGRMLDMMERKRVKISGIKWLVLDEADEMLNMGFKEDLDSILADTPSKKRIFLFSATMPNEIARIAKNYMDDPIEITVGEKNQGAENVDHLYYVVPARARYEVLKRIADFNPDIYSIVFCRTRKETQEVADSLIKDGYNADSLHGDLSQAQRDSVMKKFRNKSLQMLVATDVAARGIDVDDLSHIINYNLPDEIEYYLHRSGRTGRAGKTGISIAIINLKEVHKIKHIEKQIGKVFTHAKIPTGNEVCGKQLIHLIDKIIKTEVNNDAIKTYIPMINEKLKDLDREELIQRFVSTEFNRFLEYYSKSSDLNVDVSNINTSGGGKGSVRFFINLGNIDGFDRGTFKVFISDFVRDKNFSMFNIEILNSFSFFEINSEYKDTLIEVLSKKKFKHRNIRIEQAERREKPRSNRRQFNSRRR